MHVSMCIVSFHFPFTAPHQYTTQTTRRTTHAMGSRKQTRPYRILGYPLTSFPVLSEESIQVFVALDPSEAVHDEGGARRAR